ncbi:hypothetical protein J2Y66_000342 [Paenarthrobacter nitroguajacolicus]|uniref:hypothetical protein n=1 Tax=Paenarthrobacter nitroguajacolicus TaxID=211146 RepID=UPI0028647B1A|nr:hypothetical protein [Paenarthrobacter nitroguajacolicus]MDR6985879.1 hypothetical protein [Paenarthrobacter nitroguajacolicus]
MHHLILALTVTPSPNPSGTLRPGLSEDQVTPGTWGFVLTAFIVILTTFLIVDMVRRIRRVRYRAQVEEARLAAEEEAGNPAEGPAAGGASAGPAGGASDENDDAGPRTR